MFWDGIINSTLVGPFTVRKGVKMNLKNYVDFLQANFMQWFNNKSKTFKNKMIFMHDNAPSHATRVTSQFMKWQGRKGKRFMVWLAHRPVLNCIENLWGLLKQRLYANNKQYSSKPDLKVAIERKWRDIEDYEESTIMKLTSWMDAIIVKV